MKIFTCLIASVILFFAEAQKKITVDDFTTGSTFSTQRVQGFKWMNKGQFFTLLFENSIYKYDVITGLRTDTIFNGQVNELPGQMDNYIFNSKEDKILMLVDQKFLTRKFFTGQYFIYDIEKNSLNQLSSGRQSHATFSPDGNSVAYTMDNNLFISELKKGANYPVTNDGVKNEIINGRTDRIHEDEFSISKAFEWSPNGTKLAYLIFDESEVGEYTFPGWSDMEYSSYKYPKAGEAISKVSINVFDLNSGKVTRIKLKGENYYIPRIRWTHDPNLLGIIKINRNQNRQDIFHAYVNSVSLKPILTDRSKKYIDFSYMDDLTYLKDGDGFILSSDRNGNKHFGLHNMEGQLVSKITIGGFDATELINIDQRGKRKYLYYLSTEVSSLERHLYQVGLDGKSKKRLTLDSGYHDIKMSSDFKYFLDEKSSSTSPSTFSLIQTKGVNTLQVLEANEDLKQIAADYQLAEKFFFQFKGYDNTDLNGYLLKPNNFDSTHVYPLLIYQYNEPGSQLVLNKWGGEHFYFHQLLRQEGYIIAVVDVRGTGGRGVDFEKSTFRKLGLLETQDVIKAAEFLGSHKFIDTSRIGVWGWGYGGFITSMCMTNGNRIFKMGIAIAPITDWKHHNAVFTERYMGIENNNRDGYVLSSPLNYAEGLTGNFLIIHGTKDERVRFKHSQLLHQELIDTGVEFESFFYPNQKHSLIPVRNHLYTKMLEFIKRSL